MSIVDPREQFNKKHMYKQCVLEKKLQNGHKTTTTFLPLKYAVINKTIKLKNADNIWEDGWIVKSVANDVMDGDYVNMMSREHLKHRKRTDI